VDEGLDRLKIERPATGVRPPRARRRRRVVLLLLGIAAAILVLAYEGLLGFAPTVEAGSVTTMYPSQRLAVLNATGYVVAQRRADVASKATGRLESLEVEEGSRVSKGQVIARLESEDVRAAMEQAAANVNVAKAAVGQAQAELRDATRALERSEGLVKKAYVSRELYDEAIARHDKAQAGLRSAEAAVAAAQAAYQAARVAVEYTLIRAPFDGVVVAKNANVGDVVAPFSTTNLSKGAVVSMADMDTLEVEADVSESNLQLVKLGQPCEIQLDALADERLRGVVHRIVPTVDRAKATVLVKVHFLDKDERILPDMSAKVAFLSREISPQERKPVTVAPTRALVDRGGRQVAFVLNGDTVREAVVETGERLGEAVVVESGLSPGDHVVLSPPEELRGGDRVRVAAS
jgi:RND family efflux transporter MFP subunit